MRALTDLDSALAQCGSNQQQITARFQIKGHVQSVLATMLRE